MAVSIALLNTLRFELLNLHKTLIDMERSEYEWRHGKISAQQFLQMLLKDPQFEWLHFLSELIVKMDEIVDSKDPVSEEEVDGVFQTAKKLLDPDSIHETFAEKYRDAMQRDPAVVLAHQRVRQIFRS